MLCLSIIGQELLLPVDYCESMLLWTWVYSYLLVVWISILSDIKPRSGSAGSYDVSVFNFLRNCPVSRSSCAISHSRQCEDSSSPQPRQYLVIFCYFLKSSHPNGCEVVFYGGFDLHFHHDKWCWATFHMLVGHLSILFGEMSFQVLWPFLRLGYLYFPVDSWFLIHSLIRCMIDKYRSHSVGSFSSLLIVSFDVQKSSIFT